MVELRFVFHCSGFTLQSEVQFETGEIFLATIVQDSRPALLNQLTFFCRNRKRKTMFLRFGVKSKKEKLVILVFVQKLK